MKDTSLLLATLSVFVLLAGCTQSVTLTDTSVEETGSVGQQLPTEVVEKEVITGTSVIHREARDITSKHWWRVFLKNGTITFTDGVPTVGAFTMDMTSIIVDDNNETVLSQLRSDDFFAVATYPESTLVITHAQQTEISDEYLINADLTIKGITNSIVFSARFTSDHNRGSTSFQIDRTLWGIKLRSTKFFDNLKESAIDDMIDFDVTIDFQ